MKIRSVIVCFLLLFGFTKAQEAKDILNIPGPLLFDNNEYFLTWSKQNSKILSIQQFNTREENKEVYTTALIFNYFDKDIDIEMAVRQKIENIQNIAKDDKFAAVNMSESPDGSEYIVDYITSNDTNKETPFLEFSIYRFKKYGAQPNKPLLIFAFTKRYYGDFKIAKKTNAKERGHLLTEAAKFVIPGIQPLP